jgi:hypothetical protein
MDLDRKLSLEALKLLNLKLAQHHFAKVILVVGGGGSMILEHGYRGSTADIDAVTVGSDFESLKPLMAEIAIELKISADWLNPYYSAFTLYLPTDAKKRMKTTYSGSHLTVQSLGAEDVLIMKLMAGRAKDLPHIRHLMKKKIETAIISSRLEELRTLFPELAEKALDLFDEISEEMET